MKFRLRKFSVSLLKVSLKYHADAIAGRQIGQSKVTYVWTFSSKFINPPCNRLKTMSFIMPDEGKKKRKIVVGGESSRHVDGSRDAPGIRVPLIGQFPPDIPIPIVHEAVVGEEGSKRRGYGG